MTMPEIARIKPLSETLNTDCREGNAVVMVGSFAPIHDGHLDAAHSASAALINRGHSVESLILAPNSSEYLEIKLAEESYEWPYERRVEYILGRDPHPTIPTYVDDISGRLAQEKQINDFVPKTIQRRLGFDALQLYFVVGSDQLLSMESHLSEGDGKAICVLRPGSMQEVQERLKISWVSDATASERLIITERQNMKQDISSTAIRRCAGRAYSVV